MGDNDILYKGGPAHVGIPKRFRHKPLVWFYGLITVTHVPTCPNYQFSKVASMRHYKHIGLQADQEVKSCQACDMLPETSQLLLACQLLLCNLLLNLVMIVLNFNDNPTQEVSPWSNPYLSSHTIKISDYYHEFKSDSEFLNPQITSNVGRSISNICTCIHSFDVYMDIQYS